MLIKQLVAQGLWMFRWRSFLPLAILPLAGLALYELWQAGGRVSPLTDGLDIAALVISLTGLAVRILSVGYAPRGTSGRNTGEQRAKRLNTTAIYSLVRHPLYLANFLMFLGFVLAVHVAWLVLTGVALYALYYERIMMAEEDFLHTKFGAEYAEWAAATPAFVPRLRGWRASEQGFSWRRVLRAEFNGLALIAVLFAALKAAHWGMAGGAAETVPWPWLIFAGVSLALLGLAIAIKRKTGWLVKKKSEVRSQRSDY